MRASSSSLRHHLIAAADFDALVADPERAPLAAGHEEEVQETAGPHRHLLVIPRGQELLADARGEP